MKHLLLSLSLLFIPASAQAQASQFQKGPILTEFGESAAMQTDFKIPRGTKFKILYDIVDPADPGQMNRKFNGRNSRFYMTPRTPPNRARSIRA
jgi:hypothetical protein